MLLSLTTFIGRFHPVLVHLPIGILLLACLFQVLVVKKKFAALRPAIPVALLLGAISALASCISGYLLSQSGDYDVGLVGRHQWMGIAVAVLAFLYFFLQKRFAGRPMMSVVLSLVLFTAILITGHLGGSLTHGADYLTTAFREESKGPAIKPMTDVQEARVYSDIIQPLFAARCQSCHGPEKMKGGLRLDLPEAILKGGESGLAIVPGKPGESDLLQKILLPLGNEDHMPPKEKPQLTQNEIALLHWWINTGAGFTKKVKDLPQPVEIKPVLTALQSGGQTNEKAAALPAEAVAKASDTVLKRLKEVDVIILPVNANSHYLAANFVTVSSLQEALPLLASLQEQLVWLNLGGSAVTDSAMKVVGSLANLRKLYLNNTAITDEGLAHLKGLRHLQYLNLVATKTSLSGLLPLKGLTQLKDVFLYQTNVAPNDGNALRQLFPNAYFDFGGYAVPTLVQDTIELKPAVK